MVALGERMLALYEKLAAATILADKDSYQRQIEATEVCGLLERGRGSILGGEI